MGGKRSHSTDGETGAERQARKRRKKERRSGSSSTSATRSPATGATLDDKVFTKKRLELTVSLLPGALRDVQKNVEDSLRTFLLKFSDGIGGILLAFDNVDIVSKGMILNELPYIHYDVACDALVFCPKPGCQLQGVVTESFHSHISLVVHHYFNANIRAEYLRQAGFAFDAEKMQWSSQDASFDTGDTVKYVVDKVHESGGIISLDGSLPPLPASAQ